MKLSGKTSGKPMPELFLVPKSADDAAPAKVDLSDAAERAAALDIHQSWIVEAPAGSGKTSLLIQRYLKLLADSSVTEPEQVLAITFTIKATAELRERVLAQLQSAANHIEPANGFDRATRPLAEDVLAHGRELGWSLLDQPKRLSIRTIDSVCSEIAQSLPILSGSGGKRTPLEEAAPLYALAARRTFRELGGADRELDEALGSILLHRDGNLADCENLLVAMLAVRDQWGELIPVKRTRLDDAWLDVNVLPKLERALDQTICAALSQLAKMIPGDVLAQLTTAAAEMASLDGYKGKVSPIAVCGGKYGSPGSTAEDLGHWRALVGLLIAPSTRKWRKVFSKNIVGFETGKFEQEQLKNIVRSLEDDDQLLAALCKIGSLPPAKYPAEQWAVAKALFRILNRALVDLQFVFAERGECDFTEVALKASTALTSSDASGELEAAMGLRLQHILVDEMQDTSSSQYDLIQALTRNWDGHSQTAFLVGDPKQSIYLFRQARVERFLRTMRSEQLGDLPLGCLRLTVNFRSQPELVEEFNSDFASIFPAASDTLHPEEVPYARVSAARSGRSLDEAASDDTDSPDATSIAVFDSGHEQGGVTAGNGLALAASFSITPRVWHISALPYETDRIQRSKNLRSQRLADAQEVCRIVESWRARSLPSGRTEPWKIAVLCRSRKHLDEIVVGLKSAAIAFRAVDIDPLKDRPEVQDLIALTRALLHPADRVAWLAILRAPWCGLTLSELHTLTGSDDLKFAGRAMQQIVAERGHLLPDDACYRLQRIWPALEAAVGARGRIPAPQLVERTWRSLGGDAYLTASELENAKRYLQLLDKIEESSGAVEIAVLEQRLEKLYAAPAIHAGAIDLLTIHKAKGLEWDVVIVPALERVAPPDRGRLLDWVELDSSDEQSAHVLLAPIASKGEGSRELTKWIRSVYDAREAAERKRLFYVACTRAREELHLFAAPAISAKGEIKPERSSLLFAAWAAAAPHFESSEAIPPLAIAAAADREDDPSAPSLDDLSIAAVQDSATASIAAPLKRLPLSFQITALRTTNSPLGNEASFAGRASQQFKRPEGSLAARAFGNAVHAFIEQVTHRLAAGDTSAQILAGLSTWMPRIIAVLRSEGLQPAVVERLSQRVMFALENTLNDSIGLWLLSPRAGAAAEYALTAWVSQQRNIRIDRVFTAGPEPFTAGANHLWIVDYKTTTHGTEGLDAFLAAERTTYAPQLEGYAALLSQTDETSEIRLALYYPLLAKITWWPWQR